MDMFVPWGGGEIRGRLGLSLGFTMNTPPPSKRTFFFEFHFVLLQELPDPKIPPLLNDPNLFEGGGILSETQ